ncbi:MAG: hypothetical protein COT67_01100 [Candidatus Tagabacteria bacterium CG09_land_8_20_14_0_10_41_14]|uniref:Aspartate ammonia-lyase n=1 Tax=Candidatus Tagabacteria bacterium CG09_land_8_20_14_0_10_41_14 TaxID=1975021 RepID=A0A2H0WNR1_9BACT|nr:MAG: hypothetical protein COT67_01100 [Candidatus Tagabacteria bacterium CG09_land_8_20_14_0_10_41_14]
MQKPLKKIGHKIFTGITGEHFVAAEISKRGAIATITLKNVPNIDILSSSIDGKRTANIQVKTGRLTTGGFIVGHNPMKTLGKNFFYIFVFLKDDGESEYWIIPQAIVAETAEIDYQKWIKGRPAKSKEAPRTFQWKYLKSKNFQKYHNNWKILGLW